MHLWPWIGLFIQFNSIKNKSHCDSKNFQWLSVKITIKNSSSRSGQNTPTCPHLFTSTNFLPATITWWDLYFVLSSVDPAVSNLPSTLPPTSVSTSLCLYCAGSGLAIKALFNNSNKKEKENRWETKPRNWPLKTAADMPDHDQSRLIIIHFSLIISFNFESCSC